MTSAEIAEQALCRARGSQATSNIMAVIVGFVEKGIPAEDINPRENVLTFWAWKALGRRVKKGEHGVRLTTWIPIAAKETTTDRETGEKTTDKVTRRRPRTAVVFHVSQTEPIA